MAIKSILNHRKVRAAYVYDIHNIQGRNVITIVDLNSGGCSVTNDIENVIREIGVFAKVNIGAYMIVYKDSEGTWDGYNFLKSQFISLNAKNINDAVKKYIQLQLKPIE